jgi:ABC-2 type transport system ATP-binding protein
MNAAIRTRALTKRYGELRAVDAIDLEVGEGDVYGFLGANGSGKTTTVRMLLGLVLATSGEAEVLGQPMPQARRTVLPQVGALVEGPGAYPHLSGPANLGLLDATGTDPMRRVSGGTGSPRCWSRSGWTRATGGPPGRTPSACGSGWAWPPRCSAARRC